MKTNKQIVEDFLFNLWSNPEIARANATEDVTWITTRGMPIPGAKGIEHRGWDAVMNVANSALKLDTGYIPETMVRTHQKILEAEGDHVVVQFTMQCKTKTGKDYLNDYLFLFELESGKVKRFQEYWDSKQAFDLLMR